MPKSLGFTRVTAGFYSKFFSISPFTSLLAEAAEFSPLYVCIGTRVFIFPFMSVLFCRRQLWFGLRVHHRQLWFVCAPHAMYKRGSKNKNTAPRYHTGHNGQLYFFGACPRAGRKAMHSLFATMVQVCPYMFPMACQLIVSKGV